ncbi:MAG TPA: cytochrome P450, partial [Phenylobacterium sp.]
MPDLKYYDGILAERAKPVPRGPGETPEFDFDAPSTSGLKGLLYGLAGGLIPLALWFFRTFWPNPQFGRLVIVTRAEDVCSVLQDTQHFEVPFGLEMTELGGGTNSVLGMEDQPHTDLRGIIADVLHKEDLPAIQAHTRALAEALIRNAAGRLDVVGDLITRCATESCATYFGLEVDDPVAFANWTMAVASNLFADPFGNAEIRRRGLYGSIRLQEVVDRAIVAAKARQDQRPGDSLADRFVSMQKQHPKLTDPVIRATLIGLMTGFVPTNTLAAGKMLQALLDRPQAMAQARAAAKTGDFDGLRAILMEAGRLNPALYPGQWRYCRADGVIAQGKWRQKRVRKDSVLMVAIGSALRDGRRFENPGAFRPERDQDPDLMFGFGPHACLGKYVAMAQITEVFQALLALDDLWPAAGDDGKMRSTDAFPRRMDMTFTPPQGSAQPAQAMVTVCLPLGRKADPAGVARRIEALGNPAGEDMRQALTGSEVIHFASLSCLDLGEEGKPSHQLMLELNGDGTSESVLKAFAAAAPPELHAIVADATGSRRPLFEILKGGLRDLSYLPWGVTGLTFNGTEEFAVVEIARDRALADFARKALDNYMQNHLPQGRPMLALRYVRDLIRREWPSPRTATDPAQRGMLELAADGAKFRADLVFPSRRKLKIAEWVDIDRNEAFWRFLKSADAKPFWLALGAGWLALAAGMFAAVAGRPGWWPLPGRILAALAGGLVAEALIGAIVLLVLAVTLRWKET